jgi:hypothetical protein
VTRTVGALTWSQSSDPQFPVAYYSLDFSVDKTWEISTSGGYFDRQLFSKYIVVDNTSNNFAVVLKIGAAQYTVTQNTRLSFSIPTNNLSVVIASPNASGVASVLFSLDAQTQTLNLQDQRGSGTTPTPITTFEVFTSSGTFIKKDGINLYRLFVLNGGYAGGSGSYGSGYLGNAYVGTIYITANASVTVGAGGVAASGDFEKPPVAGAASSFGTLSATVTTGTLIDFTNGPFKYLSIYGIPPVSGGGVNGYVVNGAVISSGPGVSQGGGTSGPSGVGYGSGGCRQYAGQSGQRGGDGASGVVCVEWGA